MRNRMKRKIQQDINWKEMLYLTCLCVYIITFTLFGEGSILTYIPFMKWDQYMTFLCIIKGLLCLKIVFDIKEDPRIILVIALTGGIGFMVYGHNPSYSILAILWFWCASRNVRPRKITECLFWSHFSSFLIMQILCISDVIPFGKIVKGGHTAASYALGFAHPNTAAAKILQIVLLFWLLRKGRLTRIHYVGLIVVMIGVKAVTDCGTVVLLLGVLLVFTVLYNMQGVTSFLYRKITTVRNLFLVGYLGVLGVATAFFCLYKNVNSFKTLGTLGSRIAQSIKYYKYYGFSLWGQPLLYYKLNPVETKKAGLYTLDNGYMYLLLGLGTVLFVYFIFLHAGTIWWMFQRNRLDYVILYGIFFIYGFFETQIIRINMNFTLFYLFGFIWDYYDARKKSSSLKTEGNFEF